MFALVGLSGCRLHLEYVADGGGWTAHDYHAVEIGKHDRGDVLARLGPPDDVRYTLDEEIFEYRVGGHRGTDVVFIVPTQVIPFAPVTGTRGVSAFFFPEREENAEFQRKPFIERVALGLLQAAFSFFAFSGEDGLSLHGRRLRYDVARLTLDREEHRVQKKELLLGIEIGRDEAIIGSSLLLDD